MVWRSVGPTTFCTLALAGVVTIGTLMNFVLVARRTDVQREGAFVPETREIPTESPQTFKRKIVRKSPTGSWYPSVEDKPRKIRKKPAHDFPINAMGRYRNFSGEQLLELLLQLEPLQNYGIGTNTVVFGEKIFGLSAEKDIRDSSYYSTDEEIMQGIEIPKERVIPDMHFNTCAIVASSGGLLGSNLGKFIDSHDAVVRFNDAPTPPEAKKDLGDNTRVRFLNNIVTRNIQSYFQRMESLFRAQFVVSWDACSVKGSLQNCLSLEAPPNTSNTNNTEEVLKATKEHEVKMMGILGSLKTYFLRRYDNPDDEYYLLNTDYVWQLWEFLQSVSPYPIPGNPPSTGFIGMAVMLHMCDYVSLVEFVPSPRARRQPCYYYRHITNPFDLIKNKGKATLVKLSKESPRCNFSPRPAAGWHPRHMEGAVMLKLGSILQNSMPNSGFNPSTYDGVLTIPVKEITLRMMEGREKGKPKRSPSSRLPIALVRDAG